MPIEVTSISTSRSLTAAIRQPFLVLSSLKTLRRRLLLIVTILFVGILIAASVAVVQSYRFHAALIEARLSHGYLTSRPGIYAAPRTISIGQKISPDNLIKALGRSGYAENSVSDVWSGSFKTSTDSIEIYPTNTKPDQPRVIRIGFHADSIAELTADRISISTYTLEPEALTHDSTTKDGVHEQLTYQQLPPVLIHAILSIEDRRFFDHAGLDWYGVARAFLRNVGDEHIGQGGSTITQQLVKNTYLNPERTYRRKFAEAMLSIALERRLSKQDILALYCNEVFLGQRAAVAIRGVAQAARVYFGKNVKDLSVTEAATLAGMIQGPTRYSPVRHPEVALARRNAVLESMVRNGWLQPDEAKTAERQPITIANLRDDNQALAPYFIDYVNREVEQMESSPNEDESRVYTTIDLDLQQLAEAAIQKQLQRLEQTKNKRSAHPQAALVALDPHNGDVLAMVGGSNYAETQLNRATDARRQPGSTFKPFVYAAALERGISPVQMFSDTPHEFTYDKNKRYRPSNYGGGFSMRDVTMRTGLVKSLNVVTVDIAMQTGLTRVANLAEQFGLPRPERYPSLALGTTEATPLQLAAAYAAFLRDGQTVTPHAVSGLGSPGRHSFDDANNQVVQPTTAYMITNMLAAVVDHGTARAARNAVKGTAIAGKTGTSRDGWFVGYTPNLVCVVWIGFDDNQQLGLTGAEAALPAWTDFVNGAVQMRPALGGKNFECPEGIKFVEVDADDGLISTLSCPNRELIAVTDNLAPNAECFKHGNVPATDVVAAEPAMNTIETNTKSREVLVRDLNPSRLRVDIGAGGRKTLVNALR